MGLQYLDLVEIKGNYFYSGRRYRIHSVYLDFCLKEERYSLFDENGKVITYVSDGKELVQGFSREDLIPILIN